jgi:DNA-binding CsgD family transcriptional regulator
VIQILNPHQRELRLTLGEGTVKFGAGKTHGPDAIGPALKGCRVGFEMVMGRQAPVKAMTAEWPLTGRSSELAYLRDALLGDHPSSVVLVGDQGSGKTRLATECVRLAKRAGLTTAEVRATRAAADLPLGAVATLLPASRTGKSTSVLDSSEVVRGLVGLSSQPESDRHLLVVVDDGNLLDDASAALIYEMAGNDGATVLLTLRRGDSMPDAVAALWKDGFATRLELNQLTAAAIEDLLTASLDGDVDRATVAELCTRSEGNLLYLRELVLGAFCDGSLTDENGIWRLTGPLVPSDRLIELIETRLAGLNATERSLLELLSFAGKLQQTELAALGDLDVAEDLERAGLVARRSDDNRLQYVLAHPIHGDVLRPRIPILRKGVLARSLAEVIESNGCRDKDDILRVAACRLEADASQPQIMLSGAYAARWGYDFRLAEDLARAAVNRGAGFEASLLAAQLGVLLGSTESASLELVELANQADDDNQRARVGLTRLDSAVFYGGDLAHGLLLAQEVEQTITDPSWCDEIQARRVAMVSGLTGPRAAVELAEPLLERAHGRALVWACIPASFSYSRIGRFDAAIEAARRGLSEHLALGESLEWYPWQHSYDEAEALALAGRLFEAEALASSEYEIAIAERSLERQALFALQLARTMLDRGRVAAAGRFAREAAAGFEQLGRPHYVSLSLSFLAMALALRGECAEAQRALGIQESLGVASNLYQQVEAIHARAWTAVAAGEITRACQQLEEAAAIANGSGDLVGRAATLHNLARLGHAKSVTPALADLSTQIEGPLIGVQAAHSSALCSKDPHLLQRVSVEFEEMGADLCAAEAAADAAVAFLRHGDRRAASVEERRAHTLADRCEGAAIPTLLSCEARLRLTAREWEIALLAASEHSNKEIACQLSLSVRTVENCLLRIYRKVGVSSRSALGTALEPSGLVA